MRWLLSRFALWHVSIGVGLWAVFAGLTAFIVWTGVDDPAERPAKVVATTLGTVLGPMTGAISRDLQSCCLAASLSLLPWCLAGLAVAVGTQLVVPPGRPWLAPLRVVAWVAGLTVWFGGGILSFAHALS